MTTSDEEELLKMQHFWLTIEQTLKTQTFQLFRISVLTVALKKLQTPVLASLFCLDPFTRQSTQYRPQAAELEAAESGFSCGPSRHQEHLCSRSLISWGGARTVCTS